MVSKCSNPSCDKPLLYLREGRIFLFEIQPDKDALQDNVVRLEHFWLCGPCSEKFHVEQDSDGEVMVVPRHKSRRPAPMPQEDRIAS